MIYDKNEIILFLELYSTSKIKKIELEHNNIMDNDYLFYSYVVEKVENWFTNLGNDELELIKDRHIKKLTFDQISINNYYANHSSIIRKYNTIINKIKKISSN